MFSRGARSFVFLSRSGLQRQAARQFVEDLRTRGAKVVVVQGDVAILSDVERAVKETGEPLGGVVQAAMGLDVSISKQIFESPISIAHLRTRNRCSRQCLTSNGTPQ